MSDMVEVEVRPGQKYVMRELHQGERISEVIKQAIREYFRLFGIGPRFVYMNKLPNGVPIGYAILHLGWEIILLQADWVPARSVMVGEPGEPLAETEDVSAEKFNAMNISAPMIKV